jgi:hypothetical protein
LIHQIAHILFPSDPVVVNKIFGIPIQLIGGLFVLYSVNANLGLFRNQHLAKLILGWFRSCPLFRKSVTTTMYASSGNSSGVSFASTSISVQSAPNTLEDRVIELERQMEEFRTQVSKDMSAVNRRITHVHTEISTAVASNAANVNQLSSRLEIATIGCFKQQTFGVLLAIYGGITSVFA